MKANSDSVFHPSRECGRGVVVIGQQHPSATRAWASDANSVSFNSSFRSRPFEALDERILHGLAWRDVVPGDAALIGPYQVALLMSSLPFSLTTIFGLPRSGPALRGCRRRPP